MNRPERILRLLFLAGLLVAVGLISASASGRPAENAGRHLGAQTLRGPDQAARSHGPPDVSPPGRPGAGQDGGADPGKPAEPIEKAPAEPPDAGSGASGDQPNPHADFRDALEPDRKAKALAPGPPSSLVAVNFDVLGHSNLGGTVPGDISFFDHGGEVGKHVYIGSFREPCAGTGVKIVDVNDPSHPKVVAHAGQNVGVANEDLAVVRIGDRDVLVIGAQQCKFQGIGQVGGLAVFDVTDPSKPVQLSFLPMLPDGPHELDAVVRADGRALVLAALPFSEAFLQLLGIDLGGDFRIVEITDPENPVEIRDWGVIEHSDLTIQNGNDEITSIFQGIGQFPLLNDHSARAADDGMTAYLSYWDAGVIKLDISDPENPVLLGSTAYPIDAGGDAHSLVPYDVGGQRYILQNDEDFDILSPVVITSTATGSQQFAGLDEPWMPTLLTQIGTISQPVHDAGDGCQALDYVGAAGKVVLADTEDPFYFDPVACTIGQQILFAADAGALAFLSNLISTDDAYDFPPPLGELLQVQAAAVGMPAVQMSDIDEMADAIRAALLGGPVTVTLDPTPPSWGFLRVFAEDATDENGDGHPDFQQVGSFSDLPHTTGELNPPPGGWSIHNTEVLGDRAYSSWFSHGIVALDLGEVLDGHADGDADPDLVGQFVPPTIQRHAGALGVGPPSMWGVAIDPETGLVYGSDMRTGLWVLQPTGPAAAD